MGAGACRLGRQTRLADPARPGDRHETVLFEQLDDRSDVLVAPDEARQTLRKVADAGARRAKRRELVVEPGHIERIQVLGSRYVAQRVRTEVTEVDALGQRIGDKGTRRVGQQDLSAVTGGSDARRPIDLEPPVIVAGEVGLARVQAHADPEVDAVGPVAGPQRPLRVDRCRYGGTRLGEHCERSIALGPYDDAAVFRHRVAYQADVGCVDVVPGGAQLPDESHRALHVGPEERHRPGRERPTFRRRHHGFFAHWRLIRSASVWSIAIAASGRSRRIVVRPSPSITSVRTSPSATTDATRGRSRRTASSPKWSPCSYVRICRVEPSASRRSTRTTPSRITNSSSPTSPSVTIVVPGAKSRSSATAATRCRSSGSRRSKSGTRRSSSIRSISPRLVSGPAIVPPLPLLLSARMR